MQHESRWTHTWLLLPLVSISKGFCDFLQLCPNSKAVARGWCQGCRVQRAAEGKLTNSACIFLRCNGRMRVVQSANVTYNVGTATPIDTSRRAGAAAAAFGEQ